MSFRAGGRAGVIPTTNLAVAATAVTGMVSVAGRQGTRPHQPGGLSGKENKYEQNYFPFFSVLSRCR